VLVIIVASFVEAIEAGDFDRADDWAGAAFRRAGAIRVPDDGDDSDDA
jgi:hypothetical protein